MLNKKNYKKVIITILALTMVLGTVAFAAEGIYTKQLTATYGRIRFNYEGSDITSQIEDKYGAPGFVSGGVSYAPVRAIADLLGVDVEWDPKTNTAYITDSMVEEHKKQLDDKDTEIAKLKEEIEKLEKAAKEAKKEEAKKEESKTDIRSLETSLNNNYGNYRDIEFDISLSKSGNKINVVITTDFVSARNEYNWERLSYSERKYMVEDIVDQVRNNLDRPDVTGYIYDLYKKGNLYSFSQTSNGTLSVSGGGYGGIYDDGYGTGILSSYVDREFEYYGIKGARLYESSYAGRYDSFEIQISDYYRYEWRDLTSTEKNSLLYNVAREIERQYGYYNDGYSNYITIDILIDGYKDETYTKYYNDDYGTFR